MRFENLGGEPNPNFLNPELFEKAFLKSCESIRKNIGLILFEFPRFGVTDYKDGRDFVADLDRFLSRLPKGWPYGIAIRDGDWLMPEYFLPEYFPCLSKGGVTHVFNSWQTMPSVSEQMALPGNYTTPGLVAARFLLKPGRSYDEAVSNFGPYDRLKEENPEARAAGRELIREGVVGKRRTFVFVNNRLEGNAIATIEATEMLGARSQVRGR